MAAVLVAIGVMGIIMSALLPVWRHQAQREKEAELLFRMSQYARAIELYRNKNGGALPPSIDVLVQGKYLRKKYKDPITNDDFQPLFAGQQPPGAGRQGGPGAGSPGGPGAGPQGGPPRGAGPGGAGQRGQAPPFGPVQPGGGRGGQPQPGPAQGAGIVGVVSKSKETSIRNQRGATVYSQWQVTSADAPPGPGFAMGRSNQPGVGGQQPVQPGAGRGRGGQPAGGPGRGTVPSGPGRGGRGG